MTTVWLLEMAYPGQEYAVHSILASADVVLKYLGEHITLADGTGIYANTPGAIAYRATPWPVLTEL